MEERLSVFITAENRLLRKALAGIFQKRTDMRVAGAAPTTPSPFQEIAAAKPDILLVHPPRPTSAEQEYVRELREAFPPLKVALFGMEESEEIFIGAVRAGAIGYVLKNASAGDVVAAVRTVGQGGSVLPGAAVPGALPVRRQADRADGQLPGPDSPGLDAPRAATDPVHCPGSDE